MIQHYVVPSTIAFIGSAGSHSVERDQWNARSSECSYEVIQPITVFLAGDQEGIESVTTNSLTDFCPPLVLELDEVTNRSDLIASE
jgi:hypothetical protein